MMLTTKWKRVVAILGLVVVLVLINWKIVEKEEHLATGQVIFLGLAPVDPRSIMQGDYMVLRFTIQEDLQRELKKSAQSQESDDTGQSELSSSDGIAYLKLDERNVAALAGVARNTAQATGAVPMQYRVRDSQIKLSTHAFFFQEGTGSLYASARFGKFRVNRAGELLLTDLADKDLRVLDAAPVKSESIPQHVPFGEIRPAERK